MEQYSLNKKLNKQRQKSIYLKLTGVIFDEAPVQVSQLVGGDVAVRVIGRLEVQIILAALVELRSSYIHANDDLIGVAGLSDGMFQQLQS